MVRTLAILSHLLAVALVDRQQARVTVARHDSDSSGQRVGVLTYAEIATATAELGLDEADVEELHGLFERFEIELVEEIDPATAASLNIERARQA